MAEKNEKDLIGFDPLAWMNNEEESNNTEKEEPKIDQQVEQAALADINESTAPPQDDVNSVGTDTEELVSEAKLILDATLNIQNVNHLYEQLLQLLEQQDKIEIDASEVASVDTATLQLLIVFKQTAVKLQKEVIFDFPSDKFIEAAELLGLAEMLEIDQAAAGFF